MSDFKAKMHQIVCQLGLCPRPRVYSVHFVYLYVLCNSPLASLLQNRSSAHDLGSRKTYGHLWLQRPYLELFLRYCHCAREKSFTFDSKSSPKSFGNSHVTTPHGRKSTRLLRVLPGHTHTHTTVLLLVWNMSGSTRVSRYQKGNPRSLKPIWIYWSKR